MQRFAKKTVIVTGAGSGIGRSVAERFSQEGANVVLAGRTRSKLDEAALKLDANRTLAYVCDISNFRDVSTLVDVAVQRFGRLDIMVNNAGVVHEGSALEITLEDWHETIAIDLSGVFYGCRAALPHLLRRGGCIVNTASVSGLRGDWNMVAYNAAKGGVVNLTRAMALDFGAKGVRVNSVCPSLTNTGMTEDMFEDQALMEKFKDRIALRRHAEPDDIAGVVAFLASDDASFINGVNLPVDGGVMASNGQPRMQ